MGGGGEGQDTQRKRTFLVVLIVETAVPPILSMSLPSSLLMMMGKAQCMVSLIQCAAASTHTLM